MTGGEEVREYRIIACKSNNVRVPGSLRKQKDQAHRTKKTRRCLMNIRNVDGGESGNGVQHISAKCEARWMSPGRPQDVLEPMQRGRP